METEMTNNKVTWHLVPFLAPLAHLLRNESRNESSGIDLDVEVYVVDYSVKRNSQIM